jgi:hypothetical protein
MTEFELLELSNMQAQQTMALVDAINSEGLPLTSKMRRYLSSAANIVFLQESSNIRDVINCLQDYRKRADFISKVPENLKEYLEHGGFLYVDDDYGLDTTFRQEIRKVFKDKELVELPFSHPIFHSHFEFPNGLPKTHEHDDKAPQAFGIFHQGRLVLLYTFESNPSDGWADPESHNDPPEKRETAFKIGTNIVVYALTH